MNAHKRFMAFSSVLVVMCCQGTIMGQNLGKIQAAAEEAYIFAFPMLQTYRTMYSQVVNPALPTYKAPFNCMYHNTELIGPGFNTVVRANNDTLYSAAWLDLRAEPVVLTVPEVEDRYYSFQMTDLYTFNFGYFGTRTTGKGAGRYMVVGPNWKGSVPAGINGVFRSEGYLVYALGRTELKGESDLPNVAAIQQQYHVQPLSAFLGQPPLRVRPGRPHADFPVFSDVGIASPDFIRYFNFLLGYMDIYPTEKTLIASFRDLGISPNRPFNPASLHWKVREAIEAGIDSAMEKIQYYGDHMGRAKNAWHLTPRIFGKRQAMEEEYGAEMYLVRAAAAYKGLYGCDLEEAYYPSTMVAIANGSPEPLVGTNALGASNRYVLRFEEGQFPPVDAFWSITIYDENQFMVDNLIDRYSIGDRTPDLQQVDGALEIYIQNSPPEGDKILNWLPAPPGKFSLTLRMYMPKPAALYPDLYAPPAVVKMQ